MIGIYKITNNVNNKSYIGQSIHIKRRWMEHKRPSSKSLIFYAINKYGIENFLFEVLEETEVDDLNERELYYIKKYKTLVPNGYNITFGEEGCEYTSFNYYDKDTLDEIIYILKNELLSISGTANKYTLHNSTVSRINRGLTHFQKNEIYPLIKTRKKTKYYCNECGEEIVSPKAERCLKCYHKSLETVDRPAAINLAKEIVEKGFEATGKEYGVSGSAIKKWCKAYDIPHLKKELIKWYNNNKRN